MDPFSLLMGLGGIAGNLFGQSQTNQMQQQMMQQQQSFQERMSSTAYQRASTDMQAAGLNPMMMFSSGSAVSTPAGAAPSFSVKSGLDADSMQKMVSTAVQSRVADATIVNLVEQNAKIKAETLTEKVRPLQVIEDVHLKAGQGAKNTAETKNIRAELPTIENRGTTSKNEMEMNPGVRRWLDQLGYGGRKASDVVSPVGNIVSSAKGAKSLFTDRWPY